MSGDVGAHVYFSFYWQAAGDFAASVGVPNADEIVGLAPSYLFDLCAGLSCGPVLESVSADKSNDYQNELSLDDLAAGYYTVGIIAEGVAADPPYSVVFATPVIGGSVSSVPEPTTWTMLIVGFAGICSFGWLKSQKRSQTCPRRDSDNRRYRKELGLTPPMSPKLHSKLCAKVAAKVW